MGKLSKLTLTGYFTAFIVIAILFCSGCVTNTTDASSRVTTELKPAPESYDAYVGKYYKWPYAIKISKDGDTLYAQKKSEKKYEIYPKSKDTFFYKEINAHIKFNRDRDGKVISLSLFQYGEKFLAKKIVK